jgi:hypothetical protein
MSRSASVLAGGRFHTAYNVFWQEKYSKRGKQGSRRLNPGLLYLPSDFITPYYRLISHLIGYGSQQRRSASLPIAGSDCKRLFDCCGFGINSLFFTNQTIFVLQLQEEPVQVLLGLLQFQASLIYILYEDPEAAAILYSSGAPLVQVGMDVCDQVEVSQLERIRQADIPTTRLLAAATHCLHSYYRGRGLLADPNGVHYNDVPAVAYAIDSTLFGVQDFYVTIETQSPLTRGQTVADRRGISGDPTNVRVCLEVDSPG